MTLVIIPKGSASGSPTEITADLFGLTWDHVANDSWPTIGFKYARVWNNGNTWLDVATSNGVYDWTAWDSALDAIPVGTPIIYTFGKVPEWASGNSDWSVPPTSNTYFTDFASAVLARNLARKSAGKSYITHWELWNEFNSVSWWSGTFAQMVTLAGLAYALIKAADPTAVTLNPSTTKGQSGAADLGSYFSQGGSAYLDIVDFHGYISSQSTHPVEAILPEIAAYRTMLLGFPSLASLPLWSTEGGFGLNTNLSTVNDRVAFVLRYYLYMAWYGVGQASWYSYDSQTWGTLWDTVNLVLTAVGVAYGQTYDWLVGATLLSVGVNGTVWQASLTRPGYQGLIVYDTATASSFTPPSWTTQYRDLAGTVTPWSSGAVTLPSNGMALLFETGTP